MAARLEQAAGPGEVLIGEETLRLVREAVDVEAVEALPLKGKAQPIRAFRLVAVHVAPERRHEARFVGRERELAAVAAAWQRVRGERRCKLLHVEPGRIAPAWASVPAALGGAPRLYLFKSCTHLIAQLESAPVAQDGISAGEVVDPKWASAHGHAIDAARYGAMSRPSPSEEPQPSPHLEDERAEALRQWYEREREAWEEQKLEEFESSLGW